MSSCSGRRRLRYATLTTGPWLAGCPAVGEGGRKRGLLTGPVDQRCTDRRYAALEPAGGPVRHDRLRRGGEHRRGQLTVISRGRRSRSAATSGWHRTTRAGPRSSSGPTAGRSWPTASKAGGQVRPHRTRSRDLVRSSRAAVGSRSSVVTSRSCRRRPALAMAAPVLLAVSNGAPRSRRAHRTRCRRHPQDCWHRRPRDLANRVRRIAVRPVYRTRRERCPAGSDGPVPH